MPLVSFYTPHKTSVNLWFTDVFRGYRKRLVAWNGLIQKNLSPLPQKTPSRRVHATARFVHDHGTIVTDHTDQETQFSFGTTWTLLNTFIQMICYFQNFSVSKQMFDIHKVKKQDTLSFLKRCLLKVYRKIILKVINMFFPNVPFDALEYIRKRSVKLQSQKFARKSFENVPFY